MTTTSQLVRLALLEQSVTHRRYWYASSLPTTERFKNKPPTAKYRRDRVLWRLQRLSMGKAMRDARDAGEDVSAALLGVFDD